MVNIVSPWLLADAADRLMVALANGRDGVPISRDAADYLAWRAGRGFPPRPLVTMYPYDALETPYELPGSLLGVTEPSATTRTFALPLPASVGLRAVPEGLNDEDMETMILWAEMVWQEMGR